MSTSECPARRLPGRGRPSGRAATPALLVERCVDVQPGWQVLVRRTRPAGRCSRRSCRQIGRRGAYALLRLRVDVRRSAPWMLEAAEERARDARRDRGPRARPRGHLHRRSRRPRTRATAPTSPAERLGAPQQGDAAAHDAVLQPARSRGSGCDFPTQALAQDAGMTLAAVRGLLLRRAARRLGGARRREMRADRRALRRRRRGAHRRRRAPISASASRAVTGCVDALGREHARRRGLLLARRGLGRGRHQLLRVPGLLPGPRGRGRPLPLRGRQDRRRERDVATRSSCSAMLDADEGARRLGEFGIGCNPGIQSHMRNTLFDEKIEGTIHLAIGSGFPYLGGSNESAVHWDMVKDLRRGGRIELDGELVQENGQVALLISADPRVERVREAARRALPRRAARHAGADPDDAAREPAARGAAARDRAPRRLPDPADRLRRCGRSNPAWAAEAPEELLGELAEIDRFACRPHGRPHHDGRAREHPRRRRRSRPSGSRSSSGAEHYFYPAHDGERDPVGRAARSRPRRSPRRRG